MAKCKTCYISTADAIRLIASADKNGDVIFECVGLSPVQIHFANIEADRNMVASAAHTDDGIRGLVIRAEGGLYD